MKELTPAREGREGKQEEDRVIRPLSILGAHFHCPRGLSALQAPRPIPSGCFSFSKSFFLVPPHPVKATMPT